MSAIKESNGQKLSTKEMTKNLLDLKLDEDENCCKIDEINRIRSSRRLHSTHVTTRPKLFLEEKEDILMSLYKKQHKISNYSEQKDSISFVKSRLKQAYPNPKKKKKKFLHFKKKYILRESHT